MESLYIQLIDDKGKSAFHNIPMQSTVTLGKSDGCDIKLSGKEIQPVHALIEAFDSNSIFIRTLSSKGKILVNGKEITAKSKIEFSDNIKIGNFEFQIKKVEVQDGIDSPSVKGESLEKKLEELTPKEMEGSKPAEVFTTPISPDEIESSIHVIEQGDKAEKAPLPSKPAETRKGPDRSVKAKTITDLTQPTIVKKVEQASHSLRIKQFWYDVLVSDRLFPLKGSITIGSARRSTYPTPPNGLPKKFPLFIFEDSVPHLQFNKHLHGYLNIKGEKLNLNQIKEKHNPPQHNDSYRMKLKFLDWGEIDYGNLKFWFEFIQTPVPAPNQKFFASLDRASRKMLIAGFILAFLLVSIFALVPGKVIAVKKQEDRFVNIKPGALGPIVKPMPTPIPLAAKAGGKKSEGTEGEGARAAGKEGKRGKSTQGAKGPTIEDLIRERGIGALLFLKSSNAFKNISRGGGGGDLEKASDKLRAGLPGETVVREGKGTRDMGGKGGGGTFVGGIGGLGKKGTGLGEKGTGRADYGTKGEARVTASIEEGESIVTGQMDPAIIERLIKNNLGYIKWCYEKELNTKPDLEGKVVVDFIIGVEGLVTASTVKNSTMRDEGVESCIARRIKTIKFPSPGAGIVQVYYPFIFRVAGGF